MLRILLLVLLVSPATALAQVPPAPPSPPVSESAPPADVAPPAEVEIAPEEPKMKKVCRQVEVVGSAIGRSVCTLKPIRAPKPPRGLNSG